MRRRGCVYTLGLRPGSRPSAAQQHSANGTQPASAIQKRDHVNFLKQTNMGSTRFGSEQTHLWRVVQEMGGLISGADMRATCAQVALTGSGWA
jgi:hypothetical protein